MPFFSASYPAISPPNLPPKEHDYIIIGAGTAGCVLASTLSSDPNSTVLLLEKGHERDNLLSRNPLLSQNFEFPWLQSICRLSEPVLGARQQRAKMWAAEAMGGTSRINGSLWTRGIPAGYDSWAQEFGLTEWSWEKVEPFFDKIEENIPRKEPVEVLGMVSYVDKTAEAIGLSVEEDLNSPRAKAQACFKMHQTVDEKGKKASQNRVWLDAKTVEERPNLTIATGYAATRLEMSSAGARVDGVWARDAAGKHPGLKLLKAKREVIVCSGVIGTPQLLMMSGIGPRDHLGVFNIPIISDLKQVGRNLTDHVSFPIMSEIPRNHTLHLLQNPFILIWQLLKWLVWGKGLLGASSTPRTIFVQSTAIEDSSMSVLDQNPDTGNSTMNAHDTANIPNIEVMITPVNTFLEAVIPNKSLTSWYATLVQPFSRGQVQLSASAPGKDGDEPTLQIIYPMLTDERDRAVMRKAIRFSMRLADEFAKQYPHSAALSFAPGMDLEYLDSAIEAKSDKPNAKKGGAATGVPDVAHPHTQMSSSSTQQGIQDEQHRIKSWKTVTDQEIDEYADRVWASALHATSTCRMSLSPEDGVVDQQLRVHGFENLRIADASVFPMIPSAHTMAPTVMVGRRVGEMILQDAGRV
ncbi:putative GMC oxidoreductase [Triangularia verruculosa]|uniref:GMC oxidoreductase n=1 Tax=Triangularia verruculosa TaxID=2587418 RepID=A0AAN6X8X6_9PEZI|nr:putative GMC oxidoreductase [Triangularia verruculosa]